MLAVSHSTPALLEVLPGMNLLSTLCRYGVAVMRREHSGVSERDIEEILGFSRDPKLARLPLRFNGSLIDQQRIVEDGRVVQNSPIIEAVNRPPFAPVIGELGTFHTLFINRMDPETDLFLHPHEAIEFTAAMPLALPESGGKYRTQDASGRLITHDLREGDIVFNTGTTLHGVTRIKGSLPRISLIWAVGYSMVHS